MKGTQAAFFPRHDLTHYAVETVLGYRNAFYGLVAAGWDLTDFGAPWPRGQMPKEAALAEMTVGLLDLERGTGQLTNAEDINDRIAQFCSEHGIPVPRAITDEDLSQVRQKRAELFSTWESLKPGAALELPFELE